MPAPPWLVNLIPTTRCPCRCVFCDIPARPTRELPTEDWRAVLDQLADWLPRGARVVFAGGEPFARGDLMALAEHALARGLSVNVATIGFHLAGETLARVRDLPLDLNVSIHGYRRTHDRLTRSPGLFVRVIEALEALAAGGRAAVHVSTVLCGTNLGEVVPLARYVQAQPFIRSHYFQAQVQNLSAPERPGWRADHPAWARDPGRAARVLDELIALKAAGARIANTAAQLAFWKEYFRDPDGIANDMACAVGGHNLTIMTDGRVQLCDHHPPLGTIRDAPLRTLWEGEEARALRRAMRDCRILCNYFINCARDDRNPARSEAG